MISIFRIKTSTDAKEIGYSPQADLLPTENWEMWGKTSVFCLPLEGVIPFRPQFPRLGLLEYAKPTDLMATGVAAGNCLMISEKFNKP